MTLSEQKHLIRELPDVHEIDTLEALKVFADPLRQRIMETLFDSSKTVKQIAAELEIAPTKLYYHINLMEEHGLIRVVDTRIVSGIIEKQYDAAAASFRIKRSLMAPGQGEGDSGLDTVIDALVEPMRADLSKSLALGLVDLNQSPDESRRLKIGRSVLRLGPERADEFYERLGSLLDEFVCDDESNENDDNPEASNYGLVLFFYPTASKQPAKRRKKEADAHGDRASD
ncbi:MAG: helix-turn-helix transcriptional regulator [Chloroflexi bacterium]|nr:helix-turn-helix transcriptional regulator [Chloroflexota bacterium]